MGYPEVYGDVLSGRYDVIANQMADSSEVERKSADLVVQDMQRLLQEGKKEGNTETAKQYCQVR